MDDKVRVDSETEKNASSLDQVQTFPSFLYDQILMQYGLKSIAVKNILQLANGIKNSQTTGLGEYAVVFGRMLGITQPAFEKDQTAFVVKTFYFFKEVQT